MLESKVQRDHMDRVKVKGGVSLKFVSPGRRNVPDCIDLYGNGTATLMGLLFAQGVKLPDAVIVGIARQVLAASIQFTECKQPGKRPTEAQEREHDRLRSMGFTVNVVDGA